MSKLGFQDRGQTSENCISQLQNKKPYVHVHVVQRKKAGGGTGKREREFLASKYFPFAPTPADAHKLTWALAKLLAPTKAEPAHVPQESDLFKGWAGEPCPGRERAP